MAKKIRLDFSKTEERSGWNTKHMPEGLHKMKIDSVQETEAQDGTAMLVYALVPEASAFKARRFPFYCKLQQNQLWKLRDLIVASGGSVPKRAVQIDPGSIVGKSVAVEIEDDNYQGNLRSQVNGTYGLDILDDEDGDSAPDDEEAEGEEAEDEYEEAEEEAEEEEYEEEEEEAEEEDLSTLTLAELRKRAKALGVDTTGLKKAELIESIEEEEGEAEEEEEEADEDDLDDEALEDEDLDDEELYEDDEEEEEPAPAPKRRVVKPAAKAPVRKAATAAPAAKAPVKRVVKRR